MTGAVLFALLLPACGPRGDFEEGTEQQKPAATGITFQPEPTTTTPEFRFETEFRSYLSFADNDPMTAAGKAVTDNKTALQEAVPSISDDMIEKIISNNRIVLLNREIYVVIKSILQNQDFYLNWCLLKDGRVGITTLGLETGTGRDAIAWFLGTAVEEERDLGFDNFKVYGFARIKPETSNDYETDDALHRAFCELMADAAVKGYSGKGEIPIESRYKGAEFLAKLLNVREITLDHAFDYFRRSNLRDFTTLLTEYNFDYIEKDEGEEKRFQFESQLMNDLSFLCESVSAKLITPQQAFDFYDKKYINKSEVIAKIFRNKNQGLRQLISEYAFGGQQKGQDQNVIFEKKSRGGRT